MIGTSLCKWAISYFAVAIVWLLLAEVLVVAGFGFPNHDFGGPDTLVIVHMVSIGWLSTVLCGALFQFVPVLAARPLYAERWTLPALALLTLGLTILLAGFLTLGGHFNGSPRLLPVGASLLIAGFALVVANLGMTLWSARPLPGPARASSQPGWAASASRRHSAACSLWCCPEPLSARNGRTCWYRAFRSTPLPGLVDG
ncbi:hypothetical protein [Bradyrhizobium ottawaense]|uniref:hypothetical protein n=1 Tax=Bradyrhizobium ottawaense TaxID=931866 RepID=UPI003514D81C